MIVVFSHVKSSMLGGVSELFPDGGGTYLGVAVLSVFRGGGDVCIFAALLG